MDEKKWNEKWDRDLPELMKSIFPPRICRDLPKLTIEIHPKEIQHIIDSKEGFFLFGISGGGKTLYASALLLEVIKYSRMNKLGNPSSIFVQSLDLMEQIKSTFQDNERSENILKTHSEANLLILDDVGAEKVTDWVLQTLGYIINTRYEYLRPTIITSNFNLNELQECLDTRIVSRIYEMCKQKRFTKNYRLDKED